MHCHGTCSVSIRSMDIFYLIPRDAQWQTDIFSNAHIFIYLFPKKKFIDQLVLFRNITLFVNQAHRKNIYSLRYDNNITYW